MTRNLVVQRWGTPNATIGSVNEPREMEEHGYRFNEKWTYRLSGSAPDQPKERLIYWHRYDLVAACLVLANGSIEAEDLAAVLGTGRDRRYHPPGERPV